MLHLSKTTRVYPNLPYENILTAVLGKQYELSLTFIGERRARKLNRTHRNAHYIPNILSFPLSPSCGEIYISPTRAKKEASRWNMSETGYIGFLFIHGLLHLKGYHHGDTMEKAEKKFISRFSLQ